MDYEHNDEVLQTNITKELQGVADILNLNIQSHKKIRIVMEKEMLQK